MLLEAHQEYQDLLCRSIVACLCLGYNVAIFSNFLGYGELRYEIGESNVVNLPSYKDLSGIIMLPDTMLIKGYKSKIEKNIKIILLVRLLSVRQAMDGYYNVLIRDDDVMEDIIYHLINHHKYTKINMLTDEKIIRFLFKDLTHIKRILRGIIFQLKRTEYAMGTSGSLLPRMQ